MSRSEALTPYSELAGLLDRLPFLLREARRARRLTLRVAATQAGVAYATLYRVESGEDCQLSTVLALLRWLDGQVRP